MIKLLMIGDAGRPTGFEKVLRNVGTALHNTGRYNITVRGVGYVPNAPGNIEYPFTVKPTNGSIDDPIGVLNFADWYKEDSPDVVWTVQDLWNILGFCLTKPRDVPMVAYFPVDTPNMSFGNAWALGAITEAVAYTQFGAHETAAGLRMATDLLVRAHPEAALEPLEWVENTRYGLKLHGRIDRIARYQNPSAFNVIPHGIDLTLFEPRDKQESRRKLKLPVDAFIVGYVSTNQFRKRQDLAVRAFARHLKSFPNSYMVFHCAHDFGRNWDITQLACLYGIQDRVILTHKTVGELEETDLASLYSAFDVHINTSGGEGWGLSQFEAAACGVPQLVPDWSATRELWKGHAELIPVSDYRIEPRLGINTAHAVIDVAALAELLNSYAADSEKGKEWGERARQYAMAQPSWDVIGDAFDQIIQNALREPAPREYSLAQINKLRDGDVKCEVANWL